MSRGSMKRIIGPTRPTFGTPSALVPNPPRPGTGVQPGSMNSAVMKPQAMNAAMFGMIIPDRNVPNFCTAILAPDWPAGAAVDALTVFPPGGGGDDPTRAPTSPERGVFGVTARRDGDQRHVRGLSLSTDPGREQQKRDKPQQKRVIGVYAEER